MGLDDHLQGSSRSKTRGLVAAIINSFNETGNPPLARVHYATPAPGPPWQNQHIRWKDDGSRVPTARSSTARVATPETRANAPESIEHAHPPRPESPTPRDQHKHPRDDVSALGDLSSGPATRNTNGQPSDDGVIPEPLVPRPSPSFSEELWDPDLDRRLGRIFRLRVDRDGNPRGDPDFADDKYPLRWVRLVTTEHQLASGNRPSGRYVACATEAKTWEAAHRAFSRLESRKNSRKRPVVFYESLHLEFLESNRDVEYLDLRRYPHPGAACVAAADPETEETDSGDGDRRRQRTTKRPPRAASRNENAPSRQDERTLTRSAVVGLAALAAAATADARPHARSDAKAPPEAPGWPERVARAAGKRKRTDDPAESSLLATPFRARPTGFVPRARAPSVRARADPSHEETRALRLRLELVACRLRIEREARRLTATGLKAALRESRRATARARAVVERIAYRESRIAAR